ncbi:MAG: hypothetical protein ACRYG8_31010 [Janthinobacterium lividum]
MSPARATHLPQGRWAKIGLRVMDFVLDLKLAESCQVLPDFSSKASSLHTTAKAASGRMPRFGRLSFGMGLSEACDV